MVNNIVTQHEDDKVLYTCRLCDNYQCTDRYQMRKHLSTSKHGRLFRPGSQLSAQDQQPDPKAQQSDIGQQ